MLVFSNYVMESRESFWRPDSRIGKINLPSEIRWRSEYASRSYLPRRIFILNPSRSIDPCSTVNEYVATTLTERKRTKGRVSGTKAREKHQIRHQLLEWTQTRVLHSELDTTAFAYEFTVDRTIVNHAVVHGMNSKYFPHNAASVAGRVSRSSYCFNTGERTCYFLQIILSGLTNWK